MNSTVNLHYPSTLIYLGHFHLLQLVKSESCMAFLSPSSHFCLEDANRLRVLPPLAVQIIGISMIPVLLLPYNREDHIHYMQSTYKPDLDNLENYTEPLRRSNAIASRNYFMSSLNLACSSSRILWKRDRVTPISPHLS